MNTEVLKDVPDSFFKLVVAGVFGTSLKQRLPSLATCSVKICYKHRLEDISIVTPVTCYEQYVFRQNRQINTG
jgi:hypothetical protein